jgi:hypothetical protein
VDEKYLRCDAEIDEALGVYAEAGLASGDLDVIVADFMRAYFFTQRDDTLPAEYLRAVEFMNSSLEAARVAVFDMYDRAFVPLREAPGSLADNGGVGLVPIRDDLARAQEAVLVSMSSYIFNANQALPERLRRHA